MSRSKLDALTDAEKVALAERFGSGESYDDIAAWLVQVTGIVSSRQALQRWADRNGVKKVAVWDSPRQREETLRRHTAASEGDAKEQLRARVEHLEAELKSAEQVIKKLRRASNRDVALGHIVERAVEQHFTGTSVVLAPYVPQVGKKGTPQEFLAHISDAHYDEVVDPDLAMGLEYNPEVARRRLAYLRDKIIRYADLRPYDISTLHVAVLGDMVSGANHEDLDTTNARGQVEASLAVAEILYGMVVDFAERFSSVKVTVITGNHGRLHKVPRHKQRYENWDYMSGRVLAMLCKMGLDDRVEVVVPRGSRHIIEVAGRRIALMHGDGVKAQSFAGIPFYAMKSKHDALQSLLRVLDLPPVDQVSMGHFHEHIHWPGVVVVNGSIKGGDEYIQDTRLKHTPPMQILQEWHPRYGLTTTDYIDLEHVG